MGMVDISVGFNGGIINLFCNFNLSHKLLKIPFSSLL